MFSAFLCAVFSEKFFSKLKHMFSIPRRYGSHSCRKADVIGFVAFPRVYGNGSMERGWSEKFFMSILRKTLTCSLIHGRMYVATRKEGYKVATQSRAEYFRERRKKFKQLTFMIDYELVDKLDEKLEKTKETRAQWLRRKIAEEVGK